MESAIVTGAAGAFRRARISSRARRQKAREVSRRDPISYLPPGSRVVHAGERA